MIICDHCLCLYLWHKQGKNSDACNKNKHTLKKSNKSKHLMEFKRFDLSPVSPVFSISFIVDLLLNFLKENGVRSELGLADAETMLMGDCRVPLQYKGSTTGQVLSSKNINKTVSSWRGSAVNMFTWYCGWCGDSLQLGWW